MMELSADFQKQHTNKKGEQRTPTNIRLLAQENIQCVRGNNTQLSKLNLKKKILSFSFSS